MLALELGQALGLALALAREQGEARHQKISSTISINSAILFQQGGEQMDGAGSSTHFRMEDRLNVTRIMGTRAALSGAIAE